MSPFHGQWYGVLVSVRSDMSTLWGGKYQLPSISMSSSLGASATVTPLMSAFM